MARGGRLRQGFEAWHLLAPDPGIRAILGVDDTREDDGNARGACSGEQRDGVARGLGDIAATEKLRIEKPVHEIDEEQGRPLAEAERLAETLAQIHILLRHEGSCSHSSRTEDRRAGKTPSIATS